METIKMTRVHDIGVAPDQFVQTNTQRFFSTESGRTWAYTAEQISSSKFASMIAHLYRYRLLRRLCINLVKRLEGGEFHSKTLRRLLQKFHRVEIGRYSYGSCLTPYVLPPHSYVGNYCSFAVGLRFLRRNHPACFISQHPFFFNSKLGLVSRDSVEQIEDSPLRIGHDVWIGSDVLILPGCKHIGDGAIVGAGAVVTRDVPAYTVFAGNPARLVRERYSQEIRRLIERSEWWHLPLRELIEAGGDLLTSPISESSLEQLLKRLESIKAVEKSANE